jgi:hypothetical protein
MLSGDEAQVRDGGHGRSLRNSRPQRSEPAPNRMANSVIPGRKHCASVVKSAQRKQSTNKLLDPLHPRHLRNDARLMPHVEQTPHSFSPVVSII